MPRKVSIDKFYLLLIYGKDKNALFTKIHSIFFPVGVIFPNFFYFRVFFKQIIMEKFKLTIKIEDGATWNFNGTTKYTTQRLVICQILKLYLKELFKRNTDASFREMKELSPIKNKIERMEKEMNKNIPRKSKDQISFILPIFQTVKLHYNGIRSLSPVSYHTCGAVGIGTSLYTVLH